MGRTICLYTVAQWSDSLWSEQTSAYDDDNDDDDADLELLIIIYFYTVYYIYTWYLVRQIVHNWEETVHEMYSQHNFKSIMNMGSCSLLWKKRRFIHHLDAWLGNIIHIMLRFSTMLDN